MTSFPWLWILQTAEKNGLRQILNLYFSKPTFFNQLLLIWMLNSTLHAGSLYYHTYAPTAEVLCGNRPRRLPRSFLYALYLLNQWVDVGQTGTDALLGRGKKWLDFSDLNLIFKETPAL